MDFTKYTNTLPYPQKADFTTEYFYKHGVFIASRVGDGPLVFASDVLEQDVAGYTREKSTDMVAFKVVMTAYQAEITRIMDEFRADLFADLGITNHPQRDKLFARAWDEGHSSGYSEVWSVAQSLFELLYPQRLIDEAENRKIELIAIGLVAFARGWVEREMGLAAFIASKL